MPPRKAPRPDPTQAALYRAILANPDDDLPRLVYADYLDEHGDPARAEFIRLQCHIAATNPWDEGHADALVRSEVLYQRHKEAWRIEELTRELVRTKGATPRAFRPFARGFPEAAWADIDRSTAAHWKAVSKHPIRELVLVGGRTHRAVELVNAVGPLAVDFSHASSSVYHDLSDGLPLPTVRRMTFDGASGYPCIDEVRDIAGRGRYAFPNVEAVDVSGLDERRLADFVRRLRWPKLTEVSLSGRFDGGVIDALAGAEWLAGVTKLSLTNFQYDNPPDLTPLFRSPYLSALRRLELFAFNLSAEAVRAFAASVGPLDLFELDESGVSTDDRRALLDSPPLAGVQSRMCPGSSTAALAVGRNDRLRQYTLHNTGQEVMLLVNSPAAGSLRRLWVTNFNLNESGVGALVSGLWPELSEFVIYGRHDGREVAKLIDHPHLARLRALDAGSLTGGTREEDLWKALAKSETVGRFHKLRLGFAIDDAQLTAILDNPEVCRIGHLALPNRVKIDRKTQRRYEKVFGVKITRDY
jgi:uncharacterized protein (TIGR02996 family)